MEPLKADTELLQQVVSALINLNSSLKKSFFRAKLGQIVHEPCCVTFIGTLRLLTIHVSVQSRSINQGTK